MECSWEPVAEEWKEGQRWLKDPSCAVADWPESPWPWDFSRKEIKRWKRQNKRSWKRYKKSVKTALMEATYYAPYEEEACQEIGGVRTDGRTVPFRNGKIKEIMDCPSEYPHHEDEWDEYDQEDDGGSESDSESSGEDEEPEPTPGPEPSPGPEPTPEPEEPEPTPTPEPEEPEPTPTPEPEEPEPTPTPEPEPTPSPEEPEPSP